MPGSGEQAQLPTKLLKRYATLAQLVEQLTRNEQVRSSILLGGSLRDSHHWANVRPGPSTTEMAKFVAQAKIQEIWPTQPDSL